MYLQRLKHFLQSAFADDDVISPEASLPSNGSDDDFVKISQQDALIDDRDDVALPTMNTKFVVN